MLGLPQPWVLLAGVVALGAASVGGYVQGRAAERDAQQRAAAAATARAVDQARTLAQADAAAAVAAAQLEADTSARTREARLQALLVAARSARPECAWPTDRVGLLNDAIAAANRSEAAAGGLSGAVPTAARTDGR